MKNMSEMETKAPQTKINIPKANRGRYLKVCLFVGLTTFEIGLENNPENIVAFLKVCKFVTQIILETALYYLRIHDRERKIVLKDFRGQLELDRVTKMPFWINRDKLDLNEVQFLNTYDSSI